MIIVRKSLDKTRVTGTRSQGRKRRKSVYRGIVRTLNKTNNFNKLPIDYRYLKIVVQNFENFYTQSQLNLLLSGLVTGYLSR